MSGRGQLWWKAVHTSLPTSSTFSSLVPFHLTELVFNGFSLLKRMQLLEASSVAYLFYHFYFWRSQEDTGKADNMLRFFLSRTSHIEFCHCPPESSINLVQVLQIKQEKQMRKDREGGARFSSWD